jgi:hypothetical protein
MAALKNEAGTVIAWVFRGKCQAIRCRKAREAGLDIHLIPAHTDPRAENCTLALPNYHFATLDEAASALERAWKVAETANTIAERKSAYARNVPVKLALVLKEN